MDLQILVYLIPFCVQNKNLYPKSSRNCVLLRAGLTKAGQSSPSAQMGRIGRPCLARPSKGHNFWNFLGINCCYTYKKVSKNPKIGGPLIIEYLESKLTKGDSIDCTDGTLITMRDAVRTGGFVHIFFWTLMSCYRCEIELGTYQIV